MSRGGRPDLAGDWLRKVQAPTLLIVGGHDHAVIDLNREAQRHLRCTNLLEIVQGATHLFEEPGTLAQVARLAQSWFLPTLRLARTARRRGACRSRHCGGVARFAPTVDACIVLPPRCSCLATCLAGSLLAPVSRCRRRDVARVRAPVLAVRAARSPFAANPSPIDAIPGDDPRSRVALASPRDPPRVDQPEALSPRPGTQHRPCGRLARGCRCARATTGTRWRTVQGRLSWLGYEIAASNVDRQAYGKSTTAALKAFQSKNWLPVTGKANKRTWRPSRSRPSRWARAAELH